MMLRWMVASLATLSMGVVAAQDMSTEKAKLSYAVGYEIGRDFNDKKLDIDLATVIRAIQDGYAKRDPSVPEEELRAALTKMQEQLLSQAKAEFDKVSAENKAASDRFLAANRSKQGVTVLPSGIQYKVIDAGSGARPNTNSEVQIHFRGSLATGQEFASTYTGNQAVTLRVAEAPIPGLQEVLPLMNQGARWEVYMPPDKAYGDGPRSPIGPNQAVVFDVRLVEVK
jgi:FKBP-type peptidyl-prolyl cis-trans isomerase